MRLFSLPRRIDPGLLQTRGISAANAVDLTFTRYGELEADRKHAPLLICHGLFGQKSNWNSVGKAIQRRLGNVVYAVDLRNHGDAPHIPSMSYTEQAADVQKLIKKICDEGSFKKVNLLGHNPNGGHLLDRLIIEDVSPKGYSISSHLFKDYVDAMKSANLRKSRQDISKDLEKAVPELPIRQFLLTNLRAGSDGGFEWKVNLDAIGQHFGELLGCDLPVGAFRGKTLFIYGERSGYVPDTDRPLIRNLFPQVEFHSIAEAGHWVHADQPKAFIDGICGFIEK
ncbi:unnamed protein product, partial [Mesorhabditis spiculigera]